MFFCLRNTLELDAARPVSDMAAFFGYQPAPSAALTLTLAREHGCISACLQGAEQSFTASEPCSEAAASGDITRCVKLVVLKVFAELTGLQPKLPWGILTGVRPTKLAHKLLDGGVEAAALPEYLSENYLLPMSREGCLRTLLLSRIISSATVRALRIPVFISACRIVLRAAAIARSRRELCRRMKNLSKTL